MACIVACGTENAIPPGLFRTRVVESVSGEFPDLRMELGPELCNHCEIAPCVSCCPTGASFKARDGIVEIRQNRCVGCKACIAACPYDARFIGPNGCADKCNFCEHLARQGKEPACVTGCLGGARIFGDLDDPESIVSRLLRQSSPPAPLEKAGTRPRVFTIRKPGKAH